MAAPQRKWLEFGPWTDGLDERPPLLTSPKSVGCCLNARILYPSGEIAMRSGQRRISTNPCPGGAILNGTTYATGATVGHIVICVNGNLYYTAALNPTQTWSTPGGTPYSTTKVPSFATFYDVTGAQALYIADGAGKVSKLVGTTQTARVAATIPASVYRLAVFNERLFACSGTDSTLYYSGLGNGDSLGDSANGGGSVIIRPVNGDKLIGLLAIGQSLMLFFESSIGRFTGWSQDDIDIASGTRGLSTSIGLHSVTNIPVAVDNNRGYFVGNDQEFYEVTDIGLRMISGPLAQYRKLYSNAGTITVGQIGAWPHRSEVWFGTSGGTYVYNYRFPCWAGFWQDNNAYGSDIILLSPCFWNYLSAGSEKIFISDIAGAVMLADSGDLSGSGQRVFGYDFVAADGTGGNLITAKIHFRPLLTELPGQLATRHVLSYLDINTSQSPSLTWLETVGNVSRTGGVAGPASVQTTIKNYTSLPDSVTNNSSEYFVFRAQGQARGNQIVEGITINPGLATISEIGDVKLGKYAVEYFVYPARLDNGPSV